MAKTKRIPESNMVEVSTPETEMKIKMLKLASIKGVGLLQVGKEYIVPYKIATSLISEKAAIIM